MPGLLAVDGVTIAQKIGRRGVVREGVHDLLGGPVGGGMLGDVEVHDAPAMVREHDENEEHAQSSRWHREEVNGDEIRDVIGKERPPRLGGRRASFRHQPGDGALSDVDAELEKFAVDSRSAPQRIGRGHPCDEGADLGGDARPTDGRPGGEPGPVLAEAAALPAQDGVGLYDDHNLPPAGADPGQADPEETIHRAQPRSGHRSLVDGKLVPQGQILEGELAVAADEEGEEPKHREQDADHRAGIVSGSESRDQPDGRWPNFGEGQATTVSI